jgi:Flp pilus assembly protein TadD
VAISRFDTPPFDQGLYLLHLNRGRTAIRQGHYSEARTELRAALGTRPDDPEALNLLSVAHFRLGEVDEAEKITRRLVADNPDSAILRTNLGVVLVRIGQLDQAEAELRRAVEIAPDHRKAHLYLGHIYRMQKQYSAALDHFRLARADKLVREMEAGPPASSTADTAPTPAVAAPEEPSGRDTGPARIAELFPDLASASGAAPAAVFDAADDARLFTLHANGTVEINFRGEVLVRKGTVASYGGSVRFAPDPRLAGTRAESLLRAAGNGSIFLSDRGRRPIKIDLRSEFLSAEASRILAIGPTLSFRYEPIHDFPRRKRVDLLRIFGRGTLILSPAKPPFSIAVTPEFPLNISSRDLVGWTGSLVPSVLPDRFLDEVMVPDADDPPKIRFEGTGTVITEAPA